MAQAITSTVTNLTKLIYQETTFLYGVKDKFEWIEKELNMMQSFLQDADKKKDSQETFRQWINDVRDVAYEAEDLIENYILNQMGIKSKRITRYLPLFDETITIHNIGSKIDDIKKKIESIKARRVSYNLDHLSAIEVEISDTPVQVRRRILPHSHEQNIVGFKRETEKIVEKLYQNNRICSVISIVGMGGQGKTTLAKLVYKHIDLTGQFECAWITVTKSYDMKELLKDILRKFRVDIGTQDLGKDHYVTALHKYLEGTRYFIVMDDIWSIDVWIEIKEALPRNSLDCSRIIVTTRSMEVAEYSINGFLSNPYKLKLLEGDDSRSVFRNKAFMNVSCPLELEDVSKELMNKCAGLPLALEILGGYMSTKEQIPSVWRQIKYCLRWEEPENGLCLKILELSYNDLPYNLKSCFLYLASFPGGYKVKASKLIRLWIAEGFIKEESGDPLDVTAEKCLEKLAERCLVHVLARKSNGDIREISIHDIIRDLCIVHSCKDRSLEIYNDQNEKPSRFSRRIALINNTQMLSSLEASCPNLRTLLCFRIEHPTKLLLKLELLRVIDMEAAPVDELPEEINNLVHLRYLGFKRTEVRKIPKSIGRLQFLLTLDVRKTPVMKIPSQVWKIPKLRHALFSSAVVEMPKFIAAKHLYILKGACVGYWISKHLQEMTGIRSLALVGFKTSDHKVMLVETLEKLLHLTSLKLSGDQFAPEVIGALAKHKQFGVLFLNGKINQNPDSFPEHLTKITLKNSDFAQDPMATLEKLQSLRILRLHNAYRGKEIKCTSGGLPRLQNLEMKNMKELDSWKLEEGAMPGLIKLSIQNCDKLKKLPKELKDLKSLQHLDLPSDLIYEYQTIRQLTRCPLWY